uniref:WASH_WAHD domain-containing protein n=1 Tax=Angiostrongylus cantonensis TaxID=6313 RepID=A0A0K0CU65_ANGCA
MLDFLNTFVTRAETAILEADQRLRSADTKLKILEAKVRSRKIQYFRFSLPEASGEAVPSVKNKSESHEPTKCVVLVKDDPAFTKYFRMLKLGVVEAAVKLKMQSEGVDPSLLDQPYAPSPNTANSPPLSLNSDVRRGHSESSSVSSFSDSD